MRAERAAQSPTGAMGTAQDIANAASASTCNETSRSDNLLASEPGTRRVGRLLPESRACGVAFDLKHVLAAEGGEDERLLVIKAPDTSW